MDSVTAQVLQKLGQSITQVDKKIDACIEAIRNYCNENEKRMLQLHLRIEALENDTDTQSGCDDDDSTSEQLNFDISGPTV